MNGACLVHLFICHFNQYPLPERHASQTVQLEHSPNVGDLSIGGLVENNQSVHLQQDYSFRSNSDTGNAHRTSNRNIEPETYVGLWFEYLGLVR